MRSNFRNLSLPFVKKITHYFSSRLWRLLPNFFSLHRGFSFPSFLCTASPHKFINDFFKLIFQLLLRLIDKELRRYTHFLDEIISFFFQASKYTLTLKPSLEENEETNDSLSNGRIEKSVALQNKVSILT